MDVIAFYLPQFHEIPENNEWWGEGFTEWTSVKSAKSLWIGHKQPKIPFQNKYYDLLDKNVMMWQSRIARKAGISGFCFYHYWFKGKKLLEKPVENYFNWKDISQKYCLSWANESWVRTWSNVEGNDWNEVIDNEMEKSGPKMLMKQDYGVQKDWEEHFYYLLPFFKDKRYIYMDDKPVFLLYKADKIPCLNAMLKCWDMLAKENGLRGIYIITTNSLHGRNKYINASVMYEPSYTFQNDMPVRYQYRDMLIAHLKKYNMQIAKKYSYDVIWRRILKRDIDDKMGVVYQGAFVNYDDTPRRGHNGAAFWGMSPHKFGRYYKKLKEKTLKRHLKNKLLFITAWNEWAEGAYLEPDNAYGYGCLKELEKNK